MTHKLNRFWMLALLVLPLGLLLGSCSDDDDKVTDPTPATGACCLPDGSCEVMTQDACTDAGGVWHEEHATCDPDPCEPVTPATGACCLPDGSCEVMTQADCAVEDGVWQGRDTTCDPDPCDDDGMIPSIPLAESAWDVDFGSTDPNAIEAQQTVQIQLESAASVVEIVGQILGPLDGAEWSPLGGGCYGWVHSEGGCTESFSVCRDAESLVWNLILDGDCDPEHGPFDNWSALHGRSNEAGTSGWFRITPPETPGISLTWVWEASADAKTGTWDFYIGDPDPQNRLAHLLWEESEDGSQHVEWIMAFPVMTRWEMDVSADGTEGLMKSYVYDQENSIWKLYWEIIWHSDGTGSKTMYDHDGNPVSTVTW